MKILAYILLVLLSLIGIFLLPITSTVQVFDQLIAKPYQSIDYLKSDAMYAELSGMIREQLTKSDDNQSEQTQEKADNLAKSIIPKVLTDAYVTEKLELLQTNFWDYMTDKTSVVQPIPIPELREALNRSITELPEPEKTKSKIRSEIERNVPTELSFEKITAGDSTELRKIKELYGNYRTGLWVLTSATIALYCFMFLIAWKLAVARRWMSISLMIAVLLHGLIWIGYSIANEQLTSSFTDQNSDQGDVFMKLISQTIADLATTVTIVGGILLLVATVILLWPLLLKFRAKNPENS